MDLLLRKSKVVREGERALSIRDQEDRGRRWAEDNGYCVRKVWRENLSAWSDIERPKYDAAMAAVLAGEVPALWVFALDRFSRKGAEAVVPILGKARVIFDYERLDSMDERDRRWIIDRAENAREQSQRLSYNVRSTKATQRKEGRWLGRAPFGLKVDPGTRKLSPNRTPYVCLVGGQREVTPWEVVVRIFTEIAGGTSSRALSRKLNAEGLCTPLGKMWRADSIRAIVIHPVYEGWLTHSPGGKSHTDRVPFLNERGEKVRVVTDAVLPDMIAAELAARARRVMSGNQIPKMVAASAAARQGRTAHALSGRLRCDSCKGYMSLDGRSYVCGRHHDGPEACPAPAMVSRAAIEAYVVKEWSERLHLADDHDPLLVAVAERWQAINQPEESQELADARAEVQAAKAALDRWHSDDRAGFYTGRSARYRIPHKNAAERRLDTAEERLTELAGPGTVDLSLLVNGRAHKMWDSADPVMRRDLLGLAIDMVTVRKAPGPGHRFNGDARVTFAWAEPENADPDADAFRQAA
ncbi:recombinase family protein [Streptomyces sp. NPDC020875]|uniref:recombinase family protein n=1 Tax=Streptomyces sp. NPDC020875 TaxID=3154898 RepID=UPI0033F113BF